MASPISSSHGLSGGPDAEDVRRELERILASTVFRGSKRCQDFLQFVVTRVLEGDTKNLKERTLAIEVFGRDAAEDLTDVSIVRVGAREVRKRLAQYYVHDGANDAVRIDLPSGSYIAVFHYHPHAAALEPAEIPVFELPPAPVALVKPPHYRRRLWTIAGILGAALLAAPLWQWLRAGATEFDVFWGPIFAQKNSVEILLAHPIAYHPSTRATELDKQINGESSRLPTQRAIQVPPNLLNGSDFVPALDQYVGFGDTVAALHMTTLFVEHHRTTRVRLADRVEFNELLGAGAVLIGAAFTNRWTAELTKQYRFQFGYLDSKPCINDSQSKRRWTLNKNDNGRSAEDYILVCRLPHPQTNGFVVVGGGLNGYGTEEAGRILARPDSLVPILKKLPAGWQNRNLELVLHVEVIGDAPALPEMVAAYAW
jgi:hypothetical protein